MTAKVAHTSDAKTKVDDFVVFTIVANNYLAYAKTLMTSVQASHPKSRRFIIICDELSPMIDYDDFPAEVIRARDLAIADFERMGFVYDVMELSTAIKPYTFLYLFDRYEAPGFLYIDPDIIVLRPLQHIREAFDRGHTMVLTPHMTRPLQDGSEPSDLTIMKSGVYNLGFLGATSALECYDYIGWWADRCRRDAIVDIAEHKFTDQRWMDLAPAFVAGSYILRHPGHNLAYWNLVHRPVTLEGKNYRVGEHMVYFVHFSGVVPNNTKIFSKHQDRFTVESIGGLRPLFEYYLSQLLQNGWAQSSSVPYAYNSFSNGRRIHRTMRLSFRRHDDLGWPPLISPLEEDGSRYDGPEPLLEHLGAPLITRTLFEAWHRRPDLQQAFKLTTEAGRGDFIRWALENARKEEAFDDLSMDAALMALNAQNAPAQPEPESAGEFVLESRPLPWPPQGPLAYTGPRSNLSGWLGETVPLWIHGDGAPIPLPRALAMLWESRHDLRHHFPNSNLGELERYLVWCLVNAGREGSMDPAILEPALSQYLETAEGGGGAEVPRTRLMRLLRGLYSGAFHAMVRDNPHSPIADQIVALWLCGAARRQFLLPQSFLASVQLWLLKPSDVFANQPLGLSRAMELVYSLRSDLQAAFDIATREGCIAFASWFLNNGAIEHDFVPELIPEAFVQFLKQPASQRKGAVLTNFHHIAWLRRGDLHRPFPLTTAESEAAFVEWTQNEGLSDLAFGFWIPFLFPIDRVGHVRHSSADICLTGLWSSPSGRGEDVRMTAAVLALKEIDFVVFDRFKGIFVDGDGCEVNIDPGTIAINIVHLNADTACSDFLALRKAGVHNAYTVGYWAWELERMPQEWRASYSYYDEIWAASEFAQRAFASEHLRPVELLPMAVETPQIDLSKDRSSFQLPGDSFVFYYGFDFRSFMSRKNPAAAIDAFRMAFPDRDEKVALLLKTMGASQRPQEHARLTELLGGDSRIELRDCEYSPRDLATLISLCDCYVSPHRSEGFGRGPAEAMRLGVPVIVTGYSGNIDFTRPNSTSLIDYFLVEVQEGQYPGWEGQVWADVSVEHMAKLMRRLVAAPERAREQAEIGRIFMADHYSVAAVAPRFAERLAEIRALLFIDRAT